MRKPLIVHAGCGGRVWALVLAGTKALVSMRCDTVITDQQELSPRPSGFKPDETLQTQGRTWIGGDKETQP